MVRQRVLQSPDLAEGEKKTVQVEGVDIMVARIGGAVYATSDTCTHEYCSLGGEGFLDGTGIVCGCHGACFDIESGKVLSLPATVDLKTYKTEEADGNIYILV